jgi:shikimate kinase
MGVGKGTTARAFSKKYNVYNIDTDDLIESKEKTVVLLDASFEWIHNRLKTAKNSETKLAKRPLFSQEKEARKLYNEREKAYKKLADVVVDVENLSLDEQLAFIAKKCKL